MLTDDDRLAVAPLETRGVEVAAVPWSSATAWDRFDAVVIRSTWDYHLRHARFLRWLEGFETGPGPSIWNRPPVVRANLHKRYLLDLAGAGVEIEPTVLVEKGEAVELDDVLEARGWHEVVVKPAVSASAHRTWRAARGEDGGGARFRRSVARQDLLVQRYDPLVAEAGEWSLVFFDGRYSHAVLKRAAAGEFRVQPRLGGRMEPRSAPEALIGDAMRALAAIDAAPLYGRVDGVARDGRLVVMEVELVEPSLFLAADPVAPERFAAAITRRVSEDGARGPGGGG